MTSNVGSLAGDESFAGAGKTESRDIQCVNTKLDTPRCTGAFGIKGWSQAGINILDWLTNAREPSNLSKMHCALH